MAIFRKYNPIPHDRSFQDRRRHQKLIKQCIKKNLVDILSEESLIGENKNKKIKIPIRGIKEYEFIYGSNVSKVGSGNGSEKRGEKIGRDKQFSKQGQNKAGNEEGEDIFETEITIEEIFEYMFDDLKLPNLKKKKFGEMIGNGARRKCGYQKNGIFPRIAKKRTVVEKLKRKQGKRRVFKKKNYTLSKNVIDDNIGRFPFKKDDIRYFRVKKNKKKDFKAVVICIMDTSASMDQSKKYLARSFFFMIYSFIKLKYEDAKIEFIAHSTTGKVVTEEEFFHKVESGGTYISSGYDKALDIIQQKYNPENYNIYAFHASDGDNWSEDNEKAIKSANKLSDICNLVGYMEIMTYGYESSISKRFSKEVNEDNFVCVTMQTKEDLWKALKEMFKAEIKISEK